MPSDLAFRRLLLDLADAMSAEEHKRFLFLLGDDIPRRVKDDSLLDVFEALIERERISPGDCTYLETIFTRLKLNKLVYKIARYTAGHSSVHPVPPTTMTFQPFDIGTPTTRGRQDDRSDQQQIFQSILQDMDEDAPMILHEEKKKAKETPADIPLVVGKNELRIFEKELWTDEFLKKINVKLRPYQYQRELVQSAIQAGNTIICLHAGSGKTLMAGLLFKYYWMKKQQLAPANKQKFLSFFCVSRRALLKQQHERLSQVGNLRMVTCDDTNDVTQYTNDYEVILCTPQKLLNSLRSKLLSISLIDVLCFDECADRQTYHGYVEIMQYVTCQGIYPIPPANQLPIILGLTATIDVFGSDSQIIMNKLSLLCATFNATTVTTVSKKESEEELQRYVNPALATEICPVEKDRNFEEIRSSIQKDLENFILKLFSELETNPSRIFPEKDLDDNGYEQELQLLKQSAEMKQDFHSVILLTYVLAIDRHINALADLTPQLVLSSLRDYFRSIYQSRQHPIKIDTSIYNQCWDLIDSSLDSLERKSQVVSNPKLEKLVDLLRAHTKEPNHRALILVERTFYAERISEFLRTYADCQDILRPRYLVSQNSNDCKKPGQADESILNDFQTGFFNVLVSTDNLQTGVDIPDCSAIIRYEFVPDSVGTVQTRVRARATNAKSYLITTRNSRNHLKEEASRENDQNMQGVVETWKTISHEQFKQRVVDQQMDLINQWKDALRKSCLPRPTTTTSSAIHGEVLCRSCGYFLGPLSRLCCYDQFYFINDCDFYNRIKEIEYETPEEFQRKRVLGSALCGNKSCRAKLGLYALLKEHPEHPPVYPLKCKAVKIRQTQNDRNNNPILIKSQWKQIPFHIPTFQETQRETEDIFYDALDYVPSLSD